MGLSVEILQGAYSDGGILGYCVVLLQYIRRQFYFYWFYPCLPPLISHPNVLGTAGTRPGWTRYVRSLPSPLCCVLPDLTAVSTSIKVNSGQKSIAIESNLIKHTVLLGGAYNPLVLRLPSHPKGRSKHTFAQRVFMLTSSRWNMRGKEKSHGVRYPSCEPSIHFVERGEAFAIFFLVRIVDSPLAFSISGFTPT